MNYVEVTDQKESLNTKTRKNRNQKKEAMSRVPESAHNLLMRKHSNDYQYNLEYLKKYRLEHDQSALEWLMQRTGLSKQSREQLQMRDLRFGFLCICLSRLIR